MSDANFSRTSPPARTTSLADLVHKTETTPPLRQLQRPHTADSDDGSQQERNHQRPPVSNLPRLPPPGDVSRTARNTGNAEADTSPKHPYRKRKLSHVPPNPPDLSSLTQKPEDHASSVAQPGRVRLSPPRPDDPVQEKRLRPDGVEGSTEMLPNANSEQQSPGKIRRRVVGKDNRTELLEENRALRIELENVKYRLRKAESLCRKQKKSTAQKDLLLAKYRSQLVGLFEAGEDELFQIKQPRGARGSPHSPENREGKETSKVDGESISNSQDEEEWSTYSAPSGSYDREQSEDRRRNSERDPYGRSEAGIRKHRRTRAPAWTPEEEEIFMEAYNKHGCRWKLFQDSLPGRSRRQIQSHGSYLIRQGKLLKKNSRPWQRRKPRTGPPSSSVKDAEVEMDGADRSDGE